MRRLLPNLLKPIINFSYHIGGGGNFGLESFKIDRSAKFERGATWEEKRDRSKTWKGVCGNRLRSKQYVEFGNGNYYFL